MGFVFLFLFFYVVYFLEETETFHILKNYRLIVSFLQKFHLFLFLFAPNFQLFVGFLNQDDFLNSYFENLYLFINSMYLLPAGPDSSVGLYNKWFLFTSNSRRFSSIYPFLTAKNACINRLETPLIPFDFCVVLIFLYN